MTTFSPSKILTGNYTKIKTVIHRPTMKNELICLSVSQKKTHATQHLIFKNCYHSIKIYSGFICFSNFQNNTPFCCWLSHKIYFYIEIQLFLCQ